MPNGDIAAEVEVGGLGDFAEFVFAVLLLISLPFLNSIEIGRASCRERVFSSV